MTEELERFINKVFKEILKNTEITNTFFRTVEEKARLKKEYDKICRQSNKNTVNRKIGLLIKQKLALTNKGIEKVPPRLIKSYTKH
jgi:hypothetical protein